MTSRQRIITKFSETNITVEEIFCRNQTKCNVTQKKKERKQGE